MRGEVVVTLSVANYVLYEKFQNYFLPSNGGLEPARQADVF